MRANLMLGVVVMLAMMGVGCASVPDGFSETQKEYVRSAIAEHERSSEAVFTKEIAEQDAKGLAEFEQIMGLIAGLQDLHEKQIDDILDLALKARRLEASLCLLDYEHAGTALGAAGALFILSGDDVDAESTHHLMIRGPSTEYYNENSSICSTSEGDFRLKQKE